MAYNEALAARIRTFLVDNPSIVEQKMFGGFAIMCQGHMACGIIGDDLMVRVGADGFEAALQLPHVRPMDFTGRPMKAYVYVAPAGSSADSDLRSWIDRGIAYTRSLPPK